MRLVRERRQHFVLLPELGRLNVFGEIVRFAVAEQRVFDDENVPVHSVKSWRPFHGQIGKSSTSKNFDPSRTQFSTRTFGLSVIDIPKMSPIPLELTRFFPAVFGTLDTLVLFDAMNRRASNVCWSAQNNLERSIPSPIPFRPQPMRLQICPAPGAEKLYTMFARV